MSVYARLENRTPPHCKFWMVTHPEFAQNRWCVTVTWGRIGSAGQSKPKFFLTEYAAQQFMTKTTFLKCSDGYHVVSGSLAFDWAKGGGKPKKKVKMTLEPAPEPAPEPEPTFRRFILRD